MGGVKNTFINGANAPSSPNFCIDKDFLDYNNIDIRIIEWYFKTPFTKEINYYDIDDRVSVVEIIEEFGDNIKIRTETIGTKQKKLIIDRFKYNYL